MFTIIRNNIHCRVSVSDISKTDLVLCADGRFKLAVEIPSLYAFLSHAKRVRERVEAQERNGWLAVLIFVGLALFLFLEFCDPPPRAGFRWRPRNDEPLPAGTRALVRERDGEICAYCRRHSPHGHVDHRVSRVNGGSNRLNNLSWACPPCNLKKGPMNARQFIRLYTRSVQI